MVKSNHPIPSTGLFYYFETTLTSVDSLTSSIAKPKVSVGFSFEKANGGMDRASEEDNV